MKLTFRAKLIIILGAAAFALLLAVVVSAVVASRVDQQLTRIRERYVPKVELAPQLEGQFERLRRDFQDAVGARDGDALEATHDVQRNLLDRIAAAGEAVDPGTVAELRSALEAYYVAAYDVSRRLIEGETGERLVDDMAAMQTKQARAMAILKRATSFDRGELAGAFAAATEAQATAGRVRLLVSLACLLFVTALSLWLSRGTLAALAELTSGFARFGKGDFGSPIRVESRDELGDVAARANEMAKSLLRLNLERDRADWLKAGQAGLAEELRGELEPDEAASRAVSFLARHLEAPAAALYYAGQDRVLRLLGHYALSHAGTEHETMPTFRPGEGLVGQAALQKEIIVIADPPAGYLRIRSGLGESAPRGIILLPLVHLGRVMGVFEVAVFKPWSEVDGELLLSVRETLAIALEVALARSAMRELLAETQRQAQRLSAQEAELQANNEELQTQQEELTQTNEELTQQAEELELQRRTLQEKNRELDDARRGLEQKADELTKVSAYKSQFLANMSHELRTPLNSMLLLSNLLAENETKNLTDKQVEFCKTIYSAGKDLLALINQVLDLAKVEAGKQSVSIEPLALGKLIEHALRVFKPLASDRGLGFVAEVSPGLPDFIVTDGRRVQQILNNLLANAIKFTERGEVALRIHKPEPGVRFGRDDMSIERAVALTVSDTGLGIAPEHRERIFAPFEQVEAASDRRYGGTGLGLTIARELARLLGGELQMRSTLGEGSTFVCYLPHEQSAATLGGETSASKSMPSQGAPLLDGAVSFFPRGSENGQAPVGAGEEYLLVIEDDAVFARAFGEVIHRQGLKCVVATDGKTGLRWAKERQPHGIILDVKLPDFDGFKVMEELRADPLTAKIPVHFVSAVDSAERGMAMGAVGYLTKPATRRDLVRVVESFAGKEIEHARRILVVESDSAAGESLEKELAAEKLETRRVTSAKAALEVLKEERYGCMILDLSLPDMDGLELLNSLREQCGADMPSVVVYTARPLNKIEATRLDAYTEAVVLKDGSSGERLLDEIRLFVRRLEEGLGPRRPAALRAIPTDVRLEGRKVLVADDDMRTIYALSATLRAKGAEVLVADTGCVALDILAEHPDVEVVLMDIMMPEMDGYEAIRRMRAEPRFQKTPVIALTAKAMKGDRDKCLEVGASDYLAKPIDPERLLAMIHSWLPRSPRDAS